MTTKIAHCSKIKGKKVQFEGALRLIFHQRLKVFVEKAYQHPHFHGTIFPNFSSL